MAIILGIIVLIFIFIFWNKSTKGSTKDADNRNKSTEGATKKTGNKAVNNPLPYGMAWPEPKSDNLWDSFDYFVRLGEVWAKHTSSIDENTVYLRYVVKDFGPYGEQHDGDRGHFELAMSELSSAKNLLSDIPYLQTLGKEFIGYDPSSTILSMDEQRIRNNIMDEAPHASDINFQLREICNGDRNGAIFAVDVKFHGLN